jgi:hypothetical protein
MTGRAMRPSVSSSETGHFSSSTNRRFVECGVELKLRNPEVMVVVTSIKCRHATVAINAADSVQPQASIFVRAECVHEKHTTHQRRRALSAEVLFYHYTHTTPFG